MEEALRLVFVHEDVLVDSGHTELRVVDRFVLLALLVIRDIDIDHLYHFHDVFVGELGDVLFPKVSLDIFLDLVGAELSITLLVFRKVSLDTFLDLVGAELSITLLVK